ncbi:MAG: hypothetical protein V3V00_10670 [Saprospiraceae bacterium]
MTTIATQPKALLLANQLKGFQPCSEDYNNEYLYVTTPLGGANFG